MKGSQVENHCPRWWKRWRDGTGDWMPAGRTEEKGGTATSGSYAPGANLGNAMLWLCDSTPQQTQERAKECVRRPENRNGICEVHDDLKPIQALLSSR